MGAAPSKEVSTLYSYFRGTYEIGLIPLTKKFFGHPAADDASADGLPAHAMATAELRRQFVLMRRDPAIVYANAREKVVTSWSELLSNPFTEKDLDTFLDLVEKDLYATDADMVADVDRAIIPVPCALCLACKDGQERPGCFLWHGRSIVVIGYFGCMSEALRKAFKITKGKCTATNPSESGSNASMANDDHEPHLDSSDANGVRLFMNAAVLASAGDRTLERVLVLASVMLRNQYLEAALRVADSFQHSAEHPTDVTYLKVSNLLNKVCIGSSHDSDCTPMTESQVQGSVAIVAQAKQEALRAFERRIRHITVSVETAVDNYSSLKSLTENVAFLQCQTDVDPNLCLVKLPNDMCTASKSAESGEEVTPGIHASLLNDQCEGDEHACLTDAHVSQTSCFTQALDFDVDLKEESHNENGPSSVAAASIVTPIGGNAVAAAEITNDTIHGQLATDEMCQLFIQHKKADGEKQHIGKEMAVELVRFRFESQYVAQATMWASSLLTAPLRIAGGSWVQYKLKDESEELRQTLHEKDSIVARWRDECKELASRYMGSATEALLRHVKRLQEEVERARALPQGSWTEEKLICTREGRTCALHHTSFGTMLVGIRSRKENEEAKKQEKKKRLLREGMPPCEEGGGSSQFVDGRENVALSNPTRSNGSNSDSNISHTLVPMPSGVYQPQVGPTAFFPAANNFVPPPQSLPPPPPFPFFPATATPANPLGVPTAPVINSTFSAANEESGSGNRTNTSAPPVYIAPPSFAMTPTGTSTGAPMQTIYNAPNGVYANETTTVAPPMLPMQSSATVQTLPFPYTMVSQSATPANAFVAATRPAAPVQQPQQQQQQQQQQQVVFMQETTGPGGVPLLVPVTAAPQRPSVMPSYGFPVGTGVEQQVMMSAAPSATQPINAAVPQSTVWNPPLANGAIAGNGQPNYVYYFPR